MLQRNLIYTGITHGRKLVVQVAQTKALAMAVRGQRSITRWSKLADRLRYTKPGTSLAGHFAACPSSSPSTSDAMTKNANVIAATSRAMRAALWPGRRNLCRYSE
jgi:hypothetical protein